MLKHLKTAGIFALLAVIALMALGIPQIARTNAELLKELALLRLEVRELAQRVAMPAPLPAVELAGKAGDTGQTATNERDSELARLRAEIRELKSSTQALTQLAQSAQARAAEKGGATGIIPVSAWKNAGRATPSEGIETALWAAAGGEIETLASSIGFLDGARQKAEAFYAGLSESTRQQYGSPEKLMALMIAKDAAAIAGMQILGQKEMTPDDVGLRVRLANEKGGMKDSSFLLHRGAAGWQLMLNDDAVEKFSKQISGGK